MPPYYADGLLSRFRFPASSLAGELVSPARGLLVFSPIVVLAVVGVMINRRRRALDGLSVALIAVIAAHWLVVSGAYDWWGGYSYGPRYMSDMLPFLVVLALPAVSWLAQKEPGPVRTAASSGTAALVAASVLFNLGGAWSDRAIEWNSDQPLTTHRLWSWSDPQFLRGLPWVAPHADYAQLLALLVFAGVGVAMLLSMRQLINRGMGLQSRLSATSVGSIARPSSLSAGGGSPAMSSAAGRRPPASARRATRAPSSR